MRKIYAIGDPLGVVVGVVTGPEVDRNLMYGRGRFTLGLRRKVGDVPLANIKARFWTLLPGVAVIYANQRNRA